MITAGTGLYAIIGNPVRHSLSPVIHNNVFKRMGFNAVYVAFEVSNLKEALAGIKALGIRGASITLPYKTDVVPFLSEVRGVAQRIKAVNTILQEDGRLIGYNTDCAGAIEALEERVSLNGKRVWLLGAGGASRAIGFGLRETGCEVIVVNRSFEKGESLAKELGCGFMPLSSLSLPEPDVLINATSVGMEPNEAVSPVPKTFLRRGMTVMDIVYRPLRTKLLAEAEEQGCRTIDGLEMLARQGAAQSEIWTGRRPGIDEIRKDLRKAIESPERITGGMNSR
jgi:shikimate dehydrogenase